MDFKTVTTLDKLVEGDRFYMLNNKARVSQVLITLESKRKVGNQYTYNATIRESATHDNPSTKIEKNRWDKFLTKAEDIQVVFLRHEVQIC